VLGAGGLKCLAGIALFELLEELAITPDLLVGASGGGILAAAAATGMSSARMRELALEIVRPQLFKQKNWRAVLGTPFGRFDNTTGFLRPEPIRALYQRVFGDRRLEDLPIRTVLLATDMETFEPVVLEHGPLVDTVYASCALPPLLPPLRLDGRLLADAFYSATLPVLEAVKRDVDVVIALSTEELAVHPPKGLIRFYMYAFTRALAVSQRLQTAMAIQLHHHEIVIVRVVFDRDIDVRDASEVPRVLDAGRRAVAAKRADILEAIANWSPSA
jgi:NTE family protein